MPTRHSRESVIVKVRVRSYRMRGVLLAGTVAGALAAVSSCAGGGENGGNGIEIDADDIGGIVTSAQGPEAGVWVVAETTDLPTRFIRIVATDDQGRYVLPDLPEATYEVFVRGYGLVDSPRVSASPGQLLDLEGVVAPDARAAAAVYPAAWWLSMVELPEGELSQQALGSAIAGCMNCHQVGNKATREISDSILSDTTSSLDAWDHRVRVGPMGQPMGGMYQRFGEQRRLFADWTDRMSSRPGESHPQALTEPDMNVSAHPALTVQPLLDATSASGQRAPGRRPRWPVSGAPSAGDAAASVCISLPPNGPTVGQGTEAWGKAPMDSTDRSTSATPG